MQNQHNLVIDLKKEFNDGVTPINMGTPALHQQNGNQIELRFHYCINGRDDLPGWGTVNIPSESVTDYDWNAEYAKDVESTIKHNGGIGKFEKKNLRGTES